MDYHVWLASCAVLLVLVLLSGCNLQYRMLYETDTSLPSAGYLEQSELRFWPGGEEGYRGFVGGSGTGRIKGTFIVFHGNGGTAAHRTYYARALGGLGYRVILAEYPRYGGRNGELGEAAFVKDAKETVLLAHEMYGAPIYLLGESLGAGVAAAVTAATTVPLEGVVLMTPWDTLQSVAQHHFRIIPARLFLKDSYDNVANLSSFRGRIAIVGAERDSIIPVRHARNLYGALASTSKKFWVIPGAGHNDWLMRMNGSLWQEIAAFVTGEEDGKQ